jgi:quercetin dioxygenase-like cupin family protein
MAGIVKKSFDHPEDNYEFVHGRSLVLRVGEDEEVWRSELGPGWNWEEDLKPYAEGATSCPMTHREYVVAGQIRYLTLDGTEVVGSPGDFLFIEPGHRAWVVGDETCVLIDW